MPILYTLPNFMTSIEAFNHTPDSFDFNKWLQDCPKLPEVAEKEDP
jgi:hypothetical protein